MAAGRRLKMQKSSARMSRRPCAVAQGTMTRNPWPLLVLLAGCTGEILSPEGPIGGVGVGGGTGGSGGSGVGGGGGPTMPPVVTIPCAPNADPSVATVQRLTRTQYLNTVRDLLGRVYPSAQVEAFLATTPIAALISAIPADGTDGKALVYDTQDQRISMLLVEPQMNLSMAIADWITADANRQRAFVTHFSSTANCGTLTAAACVTGFIQGFGLRTLRRPVDDGADADTAFYRAAYDEPVVGGYNGLIATLLTSPGFLFRAEFKGELVAGRTDLTRLSAYELASRLSYFVTNSMPDEALFAAAQANFTGPTNTVAEQTARLLKSPRARQQLTHFYRQWLRLQRVPSFNPSVVSHLGVTQPGNVTPSLSASLDLERLRINAFDEMVELMTYFTFEVPNGRLSDVLTTDISFARTADLAQVYGVEVWDGTYAPASLVHLPAGQRSGLFTRAGHLLSGFVDSNPIIRGARIRVEFLCDSIKPPDDTTPPANAVPPTVPTVRKSVESRTQVAGSGCAACHTTLINPIGMALENYDTFGRYRTQEPIFDAQGAVAQWVPIDATTSPRLDGTQSVVNNGVELSTQLSTTDKFSACFARNFFRNFVGRTEVLVDAAQTQDGCMIAALKTAVSNPTDGSLPNLIRTLPTTREFSLRKFTP